MLNTYMEPGEITDRGQPASSDAQEATEHTQSTALYAEMMQNAIRQELDLAFHTFRGSVEYSFDRLQMLNTADVPQPATFKQRLHLLRWNQAYQEVQNTARIAVCEWQKGANDIRMATYNKFQEDARVYTSQGQSFGQSAALCYAHAHELEVKARMLFKTELSRFRHADSHQIHAKGPTRDCRDRAIHAMASVVLPQQVESFNVQCMFMLEDIAPTMSQEFWSQLKNSSTRNVIFADKKVDVLSVEIRSSIQKVGKVDGSAERRRSRDKTRSCNKMPRVAQEEMEVRQEVQEILSTKSFSFMQKLLLQLKDGDDSEAMLPVTVGESSASSRDVLPRRVSEIHDQFQ
jgi:hypothetical protein